VLVADRDRGFCAAAEAVLAGNERVQVVGCAHDGPQALALAASLVPDLVLLGIGLPLLDGVSVARRLRQLRQGTLVVLVGGVEDDAFADAERRSGATAFLKRDAQLFENLELTLALASVTALLAAEDESLQ